RKAIAGGVLATLRNRGTLHQGKRTDATREQKIVDDFAAFAIDLRIDLVDEGAVLLGEFDAGVVRRRDHPDRQSIERTGTPPDAEMMTLREGVGELFEDQVRRLGLQQ